MTRLAARWQLLHHVHLQVDAFNSSERIEARTEASLGFGKPWFRATMPVRKYTHTHTHTHTYPPPPLHMQQ